MSWLSLKCLLALTGAALAYVPHLRDAKASPAQFKPPELVKRDDDPTDFSWVKRWAAIGDSYTAGIGAGAPLGKFMSGIEVTLPNGTISSHGDWYCARYDMSYPSIIDRKFGSHVEDFQYLACSGDRTQQIYQQAQQLDGDLDLVLMTAGGNDLCLAGIIKECIMMPYFSTDACEEVISKAEENVDTILEDNVKQILKALDSKMSKDGIVVVNGYAQFFNTESIDCEDQAWDAFWFVPGLYLAKEKLTLARRLRFNSLVIQINKVLAKVCDDIAKDDDIGYKIGFADWDPWVYSDEGVDGQMCSPSSDGTYPDPNQPDMQFIKPDTHPWKGWEADVGDDMRKRGSDEQEKRRLKHLKSHILARRKVVESRVYDSILYKSPNPGATVKHMLDRREPEPPGCPGDDSTDYTFGLGMPDSIGQNFHPNENGHTTIASFALAEVMDLRAVVLGVDSPECQNQDEFKCWSDDDWHIYATADRLDTNYKDFCGSIEATGDSGWGYSYTYDRGTPDETQFSIKLSDEVSDYDEDDCLSAMKQLVHNCDTKRKMNWKSGGKYTKGDYTYEVNPIRDNRPWPPPDEPVGTCEGWYKVAYADYTIEGGGFSSWDYGQKTMVPSIDGCVGGGTTEWHFEYYDEPTEEGYEWKAKFHTPIWTRLTCFKNNKAVKAAGGWTDGCSGND
ncbi:SGNH hydrolase-type esterase domain-containing protein [Mariannaea sp. PMI_226]|nr:SGNH hydrolase-type esterase domain-containing protein [Mariannaea sp. PMI_226]